jgi:hypothetical protein
MRAICILVVYLQADLRCISRPCLTGLEIEAGLAGLLRPPILLQTEAVRGRLPMVHEMSSLCSLTIKTTSAAATATPEMPQNRSISVSSLRIGALARYCRLKISSSSAPWPPSAVMTPSVMVYNAGLAASPFGMEENWNG